MAKYIDVKINKLIDYVTNVFKELNVDEESARVVADVLVEADKRGVESHGVARLKRYVDGIKNGIMIPDAKPIIEKETPVSIVANGQGGLGQIITYDITKKCIEKAKKNYICFAVIRNSNHYGIAGYYPLMALKEGMIGISMTNTFPLVVPTFGKNALIGTNPIAVGVPAGKHPDFLLDMATSTVPRGKLEVYARKGEGIPKVWATDEHGTPTEDPQKVLDNLKERKGGGLLPLGGGEELTGGHKGYGLGMIVEIFTGIFAGGSFGPFVYGKKGQPADVSHFVGIINPEAFIGVEKIRDGIDKIQGTMKDSEKAAGKDRIYIAGEKEYELSLKHKEVVPVQDKVYQVMKEIGEELNIPFDIE
jgi:LDH2 family malate/lactate/ureidoglycolate dehydrogenase